MNKKYYIAPEAEWLEADFAYCFLQESPNGEIPPLDDSGIEINW